MQNKLKAVHSVCVCVECFWKSTQSHTICAWKLERKHVCSICSTVLSLYSTAHVAYEICAQHREPELRRKHNLSHSLSHTERFFIPSTRTNPQPKTKKKLKKRHHYSHIKRAFCWLLLFIYAVLLAPSHHCGSEPVCLFTDGRAQNNPHPHPHTLVSCIPFCFFSHTFSTPTLITAPVYRPQYSHTCECMCLPYVFHYRKEAASYSRCSCYRCRMRQILKTYQIHRCDRLVRFPN